VKNDIKKVIESINRANQIGLMTHVNGDGDAFGSILGLRNILELLGKKTIIFSNETLPKYLEYRKKEASYNPKEEYQKIDLLIGLDTGSKKRFTVPEVFDTAIAERIPTIVVDHHAEGDIYDMVSYAWRKIDISSASEMIYWLAKELDVEIDKSTAELLLWGIETDTYFLSNTNVFQSTQEARSELLGCGANTEDIKTHTKAASVTSNEEFMKVIGDKIKGDNILFTNVTAADKKRFDIDEPVSSAVASYFDYHLKPAVIVVFEQRTPDSTKISMRSNHSDADVSKIAALYGGGGHVKASGFEIDGKVEEIYDKLTKEILSKLVDTNSN